MAWLLFLALFCQDLDEIGRTLQLARDRSSYEKGAYEAASQLAELPGVAAMKLRLDLFDTKLETYRGVFLRDWFYSGMRKAASAEETTLLCRAARAARSSLLLRRLCLQALADCPGPIPARELLHSSLARAPEDLGRVWQRALGKAFSEGRLRGGRSDAAELRKKVHEALVRAGPPYAGLTLLAKLTDEDWALVLRTATRERDAGDRAEAIRALGSGAPETVFLQGMAAGLRDKELGPTVAAMEAALARRCAPAVPQLIEALEREIEAGGGRLVTELGNALMSLTGQQLGYGPELWRRWWQGEGERFLEEGVATPRERSTGSSATGARMFGLPVDSKRVAVLVDGSGSMRIDKLGEMSCAEAAVGELRSFLDQLSEDARFVVAVVGDQTQAAFARTVPASRAHKAAAVDFLSQYSFGGTSALFDVLVDVQRRFEVDTVVLISDGGSSSGSHQFAGHMLEGLRRAHERTGVRIHTVCVGPDPPKLRFMRDLAALTGGRMVQPGER